MEPIEGMISIIVSIALMLVIALVGVLIVIILIPILLGVIMMPFAWLISIVERVKARKEITRKEVEFEEMKARVLKEQERIRKRMQ